MSNDDKLFYLSKRSLCESARNGMDGSEKRGSGQGQKRTAMKQVSPLETLHIRVIQLTYLAGHKLRSPSMVNSRKGTLRALPVLCSTTECGAT
jgi:hypothetical protein